MIKKTILNTAILSISTYQSLHAQARLSVNSDKIYTEHEVTESYMTHTSLPSSGKRGASPKDWGQNKRKRKH